MTEQRLANRIQRLEDLEAIRNCWYTYLISLDSGNWKALGNVFTEDANVITLGFAHLADRTWKGRRQIVDELYTPTLETKELNDKGIHKTGHLGTNMKIDLDGDSATTLSYFFEIVRNTYILVGTYQHRFVREPDAWRIKFLRICVRYGGQIAASDLSGMLLPDILNLPIP